MTRPDAAERYPGAEPDLGTRELRDVREPGEEQGERRPPAAKTARSSTTIAGRRARLAFATSAVRVQWKKIYAELPPAEPPH